MKYRFSLVDAEKSFKNFGCNGFFMYREDPDLYASYKKLDIPREKEIQWMEESFHELIKNLNDTATDKAKLWWMHSKATDLTELIQSERVLRDLHEVSQRLIGKIPADDCIMCAESLLARTDVGLRRGVIFLSLALHAPVLAKHFLALAQVFLDRYSRQDILRYKQAMQRAETIGAMINTAPTCPAG